MASEAACYIGTSGWSYPTGEGTWKGFFYPAGTRDELEYYSRFFDAVEVNSSFYRPPAPRTVQSWSDRTPADFRFAVKLWQKFTHPSMYEEATGEAAAVSQRDVDLFRAALEPLARTGKLGVLLAQFPPGFQNTEPARRVIRGIANAFGQYPLAVELRHRSWSDDPSTAPFLRERRLAWVGLDEPRFSSSIAEDIPLTADLACFRFHGRNAEEWWTGDAATRYRYLYDGAEIAGLAGRLKTVMRKVPLLFAFFNNHWQAYAPRNAADLKRALGLSLKDHRKSLRDAQLPLDLPDGAGGSVRA